MSLDVDLYIEVDTGGAEPHRCQLYTANITHNLDKMADAAGIYEAVWRPDECFEIKCAGDLAPILEDGIKALKADPDHFKKYDASNGWGTYYDFVPWLERYLQACQEHPKALIYACR